MKLCYQSADLSSAFYKTSSESSSSRETPYLPDPYILSIPIRLFLTFPLGVGDFALYRNVISLTKPLVHSRHSNDYSNASSSCIIVIFKSAFGTVLSQQGHFPSNRMGMTPDIYLIGTEWLDKATLSSARYPHLLQKKKAHYCNNAIKSCHYHQSCPVFIPSCPIVPQQGEVRL